MRATLSAARFAAFCCLLLVAAEAASFLVLRALARRARGTPLPASTMSAYPGRPWAATFWREQKEQLSLEYHPFGLWRSRPFSGQTILVDAEGVRRTYHSRCEPGDYTVFLFGGSSVWGYGSPDWETIPSHLADRYARSGRPACVINYGEDSWRSTQGVVKLALELRRQQRQPDLVIFLGGCNDVFTPYFLTGRADVEWDFARAKPWLEELTRRDRGSFAYLRAANTLALVKRIATKLKGPAAYPAVPDPDGLAHAIVEGYLGDLDVVAALGHGRGFRSAFFVQPLAFAGGKRLTSEEEAGLRRQMGLSYERGSDAVRRTYALLRQAKRANLYDVSDVFDLETSSVYIDACHFLPAGNRLIADRLYETLEPAD